LKLQVSIHIRDLKIQEIGISSIMHLKIFLAFIVLILQQTSFAQIHVNEELGSKKEDCRPKRKQVSLDYPDDLPENIKCRPQKYWIWTCNGACGSYTTLQTHFPNAVVSVARTCAATGVRVQRRTITWQDCDDNIPRNIRVNYPKIYSCACLDKEDFNSLSIRFQKTLAGAAK
jgi:hypothetical protein